jgi:hypothetical protein
LPSIIPSPHAGATLVVLSGSRLVELLDASVLSELVSAVLVVGSTPELPVEPVDVGPESAFGGASPKHPANKTSANPPRDA